MNTQDTPGEWIEREYTLDLTKWQVELHELISSYILTCKQRDNGGNIQRGRCIKIETSINDEYGFYLEGPTIKVPITSVCAECFRCCRRYMIEPLVPFFDTHVPNSRVLVIKIHYGADQFPVVSDVEEELDTLWAANLEAMQVDAQTDDGHDGDDDTEAETDVELDDDDDDDEDMDSESDEDTDGE